MPCGITCPTGSGLTTFLFKLLCGFGNWMLCHALSFVIVIIIFVIIYFYWTTRSEKIKGRWKIYSYIALMFFLLLIFYPSIKALLFTNPFGEACDLEIQSDYIGGVSTYHYVRVGRDANITLTVNRTDTGGSVCYGKVECVYTDPESITHNKDTDPTLGKCGSSISSGQTQNFTVGLLANKSIEVYGQPWTVEKCYVYSSSISGCTGGTGTEYIPTDPILQIYNHEACSSFGAGDWCNLYDNYTFTDTAYDQYGNDTVWNIPCDEGNREITLRVKSTTVGINATIYALWNNPDHSPTSVDNDCEDTAFYNEWAECIGTCVANSALTVDLPADTTYEISISNGQNPPY